MKKYLHSFYGKLSAVFLLMLLILGCVQVVLTIQSCVNFMEEARHRVTLPLAENISREFAPHLADSIDYEAISQNIQGMTLINPDIKIYLLDTDGKVVASLCEPEENLKRRSVDLAPIQTYLASTREEPLRGEDPAFADKSSIFTVAPAKIGGQDKGFIYILLSNEPNGSALDNYIVQETIQVLGVIFIFVVLIGLAWFFLLTKRFNIMTDAVKKFEQGDLQSRINITSKDEIGKLAYAFNKMADKIVGNIEEMRAKDQLRRNLIANISHDLRSPLTSIQGYLETILMKDSNLSTEKRHRLLETIFNNTTQLSNLVGELFELSKLDARQTQPKPEPFCMEELAQDVLLKFKPRAEKSGIHLDCVFEKSLPRVYGDIGLIERALSNLIDNALRYTPEGGKVQIELTQVKKKIAVTVSDTGMGIPEADLPYVFDRFYRVEKSRTRAANNNGAGLGLAIAKKIIEAHQSIISVKSVVNKGTSFIFELPVSA